MRILIVDDEPVIARGLADLIAELRIPGEALEVAGVVSGGAAALDLLSSQSVDLVITDIRMPGMDGLGLTETIRHRHPEVQIVLLTGYSDLAYMQQAIRLKASDYLVKPVKPEDLAGALLRIRDSLLKERHGSRQLGRREFMELPASFKAVIACDADEGDAERVRLFGNEDTVIWIFRKALLEAVAEFPDMYMLTPETKLSPFNMLVGVCGDTEEQTRSRARKLAAEIHSFWTGTIRLPASFGLSTVCAGAAAQDDRLETEACTALLSRLRQGSGIYAYEVRRQPLAAGKQNRPQLQAAIELRDTARIVAEAE